MAGRTALSNLVHARYLEFLPVDRIADRCGNSEGSRESTRLTAAGWTGENTGRFGEVGRLLGTVELDLEKHFYYKRKTVFLKKAFRNEDS